MKSRAPLGLIITKVALADFSKKLLTNIIQQEIIGLKLLINNY